MSFPEPQPGLVIRYAYLWAREHEAGRAEGSKDRPCAVLLVTQDEEGDRIVVVVPVTHVRPGDPAHAVEIPSATRFRLGLDADQSWIVVNEANVFAWPGPDLRFAGGGEPRSIAYGFLPARLFNVVRERFVELHEAARSRMVRRTE